jgi:hypothetical protein
MPSVGVEYFFLPINAGLCYCSCTGLSGAGLFFLPRTNETVLACVEPQQLMQQYLWETLPLL